ncbi:hypothetical protein UFOVP1264_44 [uncultured Caudovirales phage]|uniref:Uncharacterized protein n=1 Tax=uncultured Caudovirales phage TaxID=2100421 RepID=A0A6J5RC54_9CAUD|nr:hypothetical protein UFOVP1264_44 [uncultured Caudovirales phage]
MLKIIDTFITWFFHLLEKTYKELEDEDDTF